MREFIPKKCSKQNPCGQYTEYILPLDRGSAEIMIGIYKGIGEKGVNSIHPRNEIEGRYLTSNQVGNLSRPRFHGLIAKIREDKGYYALTKKGSAFLNGEHVPKYAIIDKITGHKKGYFMEEYETVTINELLARNTRWDGMTYNIKDGRVYL